MEKKRLVLGLLALVIIILMGLGMFISQYIKTNEITSMEKTLDERLDILATENEEILSNVDARLTGIENSLEEVFVCIPCGHEIHLMANKQNTKELKFCPVCGIGLMN